MKNKPSIAIACSLALSAALLITGCTKKSAPASEAATNAATTAATPAATTPAASTQPAAAQPAPAPRPEYRRRREERAPQPQPRQTASAQPAPQAAKPAPAPKPVPQPMVIPAGTTVAVRINQTLGSKVSQPGQAFSAVLVNSLIDRSGRVAVPRGTSVQGVVVDANARGRFKGEALLELRLVQINAHSNTIPIETSVYEREEKGKGHRSAVFAAGGGGLGALIGGIAGGGKGALIGALAGAGAGTAGNAMTGNHQIVIPAETILNFRLNQSITIQP